MARTKVKNMGRKQQKAVFAKIGNTGTSTVSNMKERRESLMHNSLVTETRQDKIDKIMQDSKLTHRQKMDRIAKLGAINSRASGTATIVNVPLGTGRVAFNKIVLTEKQPETTLYRTGALLLTQEELSRGIKNKTTPPKGRIVSVPGSTSNKRAFDLVVSKTTPRPNRYIKEGNLLLSVKDYKAGLLRKSEVRHGKPKIEERKVIDPPGIVAIYKATLAKKDSELIKKYGTSDPKKINELVNSQKIKTIQREKEQKTRLKNLKILYPDHGYKELKKAGVKLNPKSDIDGDGVKNSKDCRPLDKNRQDLLTDIGTGAASLGYKAAVGGAKLSFRTAKASGKFAKRKLHDRTAEGRAEIAERKIRKIDAKERKERHKIALKQRARLLEREAKEREQAFKKTHPKRFKIF